MNEGEWTAESVGELVGGTFNGAWAIADAHNAALDAAYEKGKQDEKGKQNAINFAREHCHRPA